MEAHKIIGRLRMNGNELKELISLSSFIDEKDVSTINKSVTADDFIDTILYNNLSKIKLHIGLFVTCKDGVPIGKMFMPMFTRNEMKKAESGVIFKGWEVVGTEGGMYILNHKLTGTKIAIDTLGEKLPAMVAPSFVYVKTIANLDAAVFHPNSIEFK